MKKLVALLLVSMMASVAFAGLDPDTDSFGVYFDTAGNTNCMAAAPFMPVNVYILLMNPAGPTNGFECTVTPSGVPYFILSQTLGGTAALDVDGSPNGLMVGSAADYPIVNGAIVLATWSVMIQSPGALEFRITEGSIPSLPGDLPVLTGDGILRRGGVASGDVTLPVGGMNMVLCPVSEEIDSFGGVKSLFR